MINRALFTPDGTNPPYPVPIDEYCTVPTREMAELLAHLLNTDGFVLEIGTGSGYQTAVLAERCSGVVSIEANPIEGIEKLLPGNVALVYGNGMHHDTGEEFDAILVTFACKGITPTLLKQVKVGGRIVMPLDTPGSCPICVFKKLKDGIDLLEIPAYAPFTKAVPHA